MWSNIKPVALLKSDDKEQVHRFKPQQEVPYCRLQVKLEKDNKLVDLKHKVKLQGAKSPVTFSSSLALLKVNFSSNSLQSQRLVDTSSSL